MKRDMDLVRLLLLDAESETDKSSPALQAYDEQTKMDHLGLMKEAGLINAVTATGADRGRLRIAAVYVNGLTWAGHDFLAAARNEGLWNKAKETLAKKGVPASFEVMKALLIMEGKRLLGLP